jgi:hypothetical protein
MTSKSMKGGNAPRVAVPKPLTKEEKVTKIMQFLSQKREQFSVSILNGLCTNMGGDATNAQAKEMVSLAVEMADALLEKLYPINEEESK